MSTQRILANHNNAVVASTILASSVQASTRTVFRQPTARAGNGQVVLSGGYTGADDAQFELEIRTSSGTAARVSKPVFSGAGNGAMTTPVAADGTVSQSVTVSLVDAGTQTAQAQLNLYGSVVLRAQAAGAAGNALTLSVTPALTLSSSPVGALSVALSKDGQEWTDQRLNFNAAPLNPDGTIPSTAPRLSFGGDRSRVYRHYKRWDGTQWQYGVSPKLAVDYAEGSPVYTVTGGYSVTVTNGSASETYAGVTTLHSFLTALSASTLVEVVGVIAHDAKPNGIAAIDIPIRTAAFALPVIRSDTSRLPNLASLSVASGAPTETVTVECQKPLPVGAETWSVLSPVAGALPSATTGVAYTGYAALGFTIPALPAGTTGTPGSINITARYFPRDPQNNPGIPAVCLYRPILGAKAENKSIRLVWTLRPPSDCRCEDARVSGFPNPDCLGVAIGGSTMGALPAGYQTRLVTLYGWQSDFIASNTSLTDEGELRSAQFDIQLAQSAVGILAQCLDDLYTDSETPAGAALSAWDAAMTGLDGDLAALEGVGADTLMTLKTPAVACAVGDVIQGYVSTGTGTVSDPVVFLGKFYGVCVATGDAWSSNPSMVPNIGEQLGGTAGLQTFRVISQAEAYAKLGQDENINAAGTDATDPGISRDPILFAQRYQAKADHVRALAGIVPKTDASGLGSACWRDPNDDAYWVIDGTDYLPVFNNRYYHSVVKRYNPETKRDEVVSTQEFGFGLRVACADRLVPGDSITITIGTSTVETPYRVGDRYQIPVVAGSPLAFAGGVTGTDTLTWRVASSVSGVLADYALTLAEPGYAAAGLAFTIHRGALPFALGDQFQFSVDSGGRFRWRKDSGTWSADTVMADSVALTDGLAASFVSGAAPNFVAGDLYRFSVQQPHSPSHLASAHGETWRWAGATATATLTFAGVQSISVLGLLRHGLEPGATVTCTLRDEEDAVLATFSPTVTAGPLLMVLPAAVDAASLVITVASAAGMGLGWVYAGEPLVPSHNASITIRRSYAMEPGSGVNPRGGYLGSGRGGEIRWENWLLQDDWDALLAVLDACKRDSDAPLALIPNIHYPRDAIVARVDSDAIQIDDVFDYQPHDADRRRLSLTLPLGAVLS